MKPILIWFNHQYLQSIWYHCIYFLFNHYWHLSVLKYIYLISLTDCVVQILAIGLWFWFVDHLFAIGLSNPDSFLYNFSNRCAIGDYRNPSMLVLGRCYICVNLTSSTQTQMSWTMVFLSSSCKSSPCPCVCVLLHHRQLISVSPLVPYSVYFSWGEVLFDLGPSTMLSGKAADQQAQNKCTGLLKLLKQHFSWDLFSEGFLPV